MNASNNLRIALASMRRQYWDTQNADILDALAENFDRMGEYKDGERCRNKADAIRRVNREMQEAQAQA